jgi:hypothetical protein
MRAGLPTRYLLLAVVLVVGNAAHASDARPRNVWVFSPAQLQHLDDRTSAPLPPAHAWPAGLHRFTRYTDAADSDTPAPLLQIAANDPSTAMGQGIPPTPEQRALSGVGRSVAATALRGRTLNTSAARPPNTPVPLPAQPQATTTTAYQPGAGHETVTPTALATDATASTASTASTAVAPGDQQVAPEVTTAVMVSGRDVNRIACASEVQDVIWSEERPVKVSRDGASVFVKFLVEKVGGRYAPVTDPVDLHVVCSGAIYSLILHPQPIDSVTVRLTPAVSADLKRIVRQWGALPLEARVQKLTRIAYTDALPDGFQRRAIAADDPRRHIVLHTLNKYGQRQPVTGIHLAPRDELRAEGTGLRVTEYQLTSDRAREWREADFLDPAFGDEVGITIDPLRVRAGQPARLIVVTRSVSDDD